MTDDRGPTVRYSSTLLVLLRVGTMSARKSCGHSGLAAQRVLQCAAGRARDQGIDAGRRRRHPHLARRLSAADLRRRPRRQVGPPFNALKLKQLLRRAPRRVHRQPRIQCLDHAAAEEHHRLDLDRARARRGAARRVPEPRLRARRRVARPLRRAEFAAHAAPGAGDRLPRHGGAGAGRDPECRAGVRRWTSSPMRAPPASSSWW